MNELLTCEGLTKSYQKGTNALDDIELHIGFGRIVGLLGPNGSGNLLSVNPYFLGYSCCPPAFLI